QEGLRCKGATRWGLIDGTFPASKFQEAVDGRVAQIVNLGAAETNEPGQDAGDPQAGMPALPTRGIKLNPLPVQSTDDAREYKYVSLKFHRDKRYVDLTMRGAECELPSSAEDRKSVV